MNITKLKYFISVVDRRSFTQAAKDHYVTQAAITQQIAAMEKDLGIRLLNRGPNGVECTPAGEIFYEKAVRIIEAYHDLEDAIDRYKKESMNSVRLGIQYLSDYSFMREAIEEMKAREVTEFFYTQDIGENLYKKILEGSLDLAVADQSPQITDKDIGCLKLLDYQMALILPPEHPLTAHKNIYLRDLDGQNLILPENCRELEPQLLRLCRQQMIEIKQVVRVDSAMKAVILADSGDGIALLYQDEVLMVNQCMGQKLTVKSLCFHFHRWLLWNQNSKNKIVVKFVRKMQSQLQPFYPVSVRNFDSDLHPLTLTFDKEPRRVIPVNQNMTELLLYFGLGDRITACSGMDNEILPELQEDYEPLKKLVCMPYPERLVVESLKPDLLMGWRSAFSETALGPTRTWAAKKIHTMICRSANHVIPDPGPESVFADIRDIGLVFHISGQTDAYLRQAEDELRRLRQKVRHISCPPRVLMMELSQGQLLGYGNGEFSGNMVSLAGGVNVLGETTRALTDRQIADLQPDIIYMIYSYCSPYEETRLFISARFYEDPLLADVPAVRNRQIVLIPLADVYGGGIRTIPVLWNMYMWFSGKKDT